MALSAWNSNTQVAARLPCLAEAAELLDVLSFVSYTAVPVGDSSLMPPVVMTSGALARLQGALNFSGCSNPAFKDPRGVGKIGVTGFVLGMLCGMHSMVIMASLFWPVSSYVVRWSLYVASLSFFHFSEFLSTALYKPEAATYESYVINHSQEYTLAAFASCVEFWLELLLCPILKRSMWTLWVGLGLVICGLFCRMAAMHTAKSHFSHTIMAKRVEGHQLVVHGIYSWLRHPSYFGWFWWVIGTQVLLMNPVCLIGHTVISWRFFRDRIKYEESTLIKFYPDEYPDYRKRTYVGIPFLR